MERRTPLEILCNRPAAPSEPNPFGYDDFLLYAAGTIGLIILAGLAVWVLYSLYVHRDMK